MDEIHPVGGRTRESVSYEIEIPRGGDGIGSKKGNVIEAWEKKGSHLRGKTIPLFTRSFRFIRFPLVFVGITLIALGKEASRTIERRERETAAFLVRTDGSGIVSHVRRDLASVRSRNGTDQETSQLVTCTTRPLDTFRNSFHGQVEEEGKTRGNRTSSFDPSFCLDAMCAESVFFGVASKRTFFARRHTLRSKTDGRCVGFGKGFGRARAGASDGSEAHGRVGAVRIASGCRDKFFIAFVAPALVALALPSAISTKPGASAVSTAISTILPGTFKIHSISMGWNKPFKMSGLFVFLPFSRVPVFRMESMETECSLWDAITKRKRHNTWIKGVEIDMSPSQDGSPLALAAFTRATKSTTLNRRLNSSTGIVSFSLDGGESGLHIEQSSIVMDSVLASAMGNAVKLQVSAADQWEDSSQDKGFVSGTMHQTKANGHYKCSAISDSLNADFELVETSTKPAVNGKVNIELRMTTSLYDQVLGRINPLLSGIVSVSENIIYATIWPKSGYLNDEVWEFEVEPLQAQVLGNNTTTAVINFLRNYQASKSDDKMNVLQPQYQYRIGRLTGQISKQGDIWLNESEIYLGGPTNEMRLLVGGRTFQEAGDVMLDTYVLIPRQELERFLKLHHLPSSYSLKLPIHGSQCKPVLEWKHATEDILRMLARQAIVESGHPLARRIGRTLFDPTNP